MMLALLLFHYAEKDSERLSNLKIQSKEWSKDLGHVKSHSRIHVLYHHSTDRISAE